MCYQNDIANIDASEVEVEVSELLSVCVCEKGGVRIDNAVTLARHSFLGRSLYLVNESEENKGASTNMRV